jgi:hypothetical protein
MSKKVENPVHNAALEAEENARTTEVGLFHYAVSYNEAADFLATKNTRSIHPEAPREFLYVHAIELYLKASLRNSGKTVKELRVIGHSLAKLVEEFQRLGNRLTGDEIASISFISDSNANLQARYIRTGAYTKMTNDTLSDLADKLRGAVGTELKTSGHPVRWY